MNVGSLFSGIGGFDLGLERAGHRVVFQCESDPYRRRVLARHWPDVPCFEDVRDIRPLQPTSKRRESHASATSRFGKHSVGLLCGGFPCQDLSVAGKRAGLGGERSGLFFEFARIADDLLRSGGWLLIENVPGLLSSNGGRDFAVLLATLADLGFHDLAWRVLDSRYLGVPQRRRRVFILARRSRGRSASEVLLEPESGGGDFEASRETGPRAAATLSRGSAASRGVNEPGRRREDDENLVTQSLSTRFGNSGVDYPDAEGGWLVAGQLTRRTGKGPNTTLDDGALIAGTVRSHARPGSNEVGSIVSTPPDPDRVRTPSRVPGRVDVGAFNWQSGGDVRHGYKVGETDALHKSQTPAVDGGGEPTNHCAHDPKPDGPRYAACGDAVTVQVAEWIGGRLP